MLPKLSPSPPLPRTDTLYATHMKEDVKVFKGILAVKVKGKVVPVLY
jgi:hypothetical protein